MTDPSAYAEVARILVEARRSRHLVESLPAALQPASIAEAHAIQDAAVAALGETVAGWKASVTKEGEVLCGVILGSRMLTSPARLPAADVPLLGVEAEIAFQFQRDLPPREREYDAEEVASAVTALAGIEVVDSRFKSYRDTPFLDRAADFVSNGAFVVGTVKPDWRGFDFATIGVTLSVNGKIVTDKVGGHPAGDPLRPAIALVNFMRTGKGVKKGQVVTTGTYTGIYFAQPGDKISARFKDFGSVEVHFTA